MVNTKALNTRLSNVLEDYFDARNDGDYRGETFATIRVEEIIFTLYCSIGVERTKTLLNSIKQEKEQEYRDSVWTGWPTTFFDHYAQRMLNSFNKEQ